MRRTAGRDRKCRPHPRVECYDRILALAKRELPAIAAVIPDPAQAHETLIRLPLSVGEVLDILSDYRIEYKKDPAPSEEGAG